MEILNNRIYNEDCFNTMSKMEDNSLDMVITSPPYNTSRNAQTEKARDRHWGRYDVFVDTGTHQEYALWTINLFKEFDRILKKTELYCITLTMVMTVIFQLVINYLIP